jgi:hypothetical protein
MKYKENYEKVCSFLSGQNNNSYEIQGECQLCKKLYMKSSRDILLCKRCHDFGAYLFAQNVSDETSIRMDRYES